MGLLSTVLGVAEAGAPIPTPSKILLCVIGALLVALALASGYGYIEHTRLLAANEATAAAEQRIADLDQQVRAGNAAVAEAKRIVTNDQAQLEAQNQSLAALAASNAKLERSANDAKRQALALAAAAHADDIKRRAEKDMPPAEEMTGGWARYARQL